MGVVIEHESLRDCIVRDEVTLSLPAKRVNSHARSAETGDATAARLRRLVFCVAVVLACAAAVASAAAAVSARTCSVTRGRRTCETARIAVSTTSVAYAGGTVAIRLTSTGATSCTLAVAPAFWSGRNPVPVACRGSYVAHVPRTVLARHWIFRFTARNRRRQVVVVRQALAQRGDPNTSSNWSGYVFEGSGITGARGTFNVPALSPTPVFSDTTEWVGVDGNSDNTLIQAGIDEEYNPKLGHAVITPWWEILPAPETPIPSMAVAVGDSITVAIQQQPDPAMWQITVTDNTTSQTFATTQPYQGQQTSAEWIVEAPSIGSSVVTLGVYAPSVTFSGLSVGLGVPVALDRLFMVQNDAVVSSPSAFDGAAGAFSIAYGPNPPPAP
jgi:hypothetical protein